MTNSKSFLKLKRNGLFVNSVIRYCVTFSIRNFSFLRIHYLLFHMRKKGFTIRQMEFTIHYMKLTIRYMKLTIRYMGFTIRYMGFTIR